MKIINPFILGLTFLLFTINSFDSIAQCSRTAYFGGVGICLPKISGKVECYSNPDLRSSFDEFAFPGNSLIGFYLREYDYNNIYSVDGFDDYIQLSVVDQCCVQPISAKHFFFRTSIGFS